MISLFGASLLLGSVPSAAPAATRPDAPTVVWLMRHAEAKKAQGQSDDDLFSLADEGLSDRGRRQAEAMRDALAKEPIEAAYSSSLLRAQETARIVAARHAIGSDVRVDARLAEIPVGGSTYHDVLANILELPHRIEDHRHRLDAFAAAVDEIASRHRCSLVVAHGLSNRAFLARVRGIPLPEMLAIDQEHAHATRLVRDAAGLWRAG